MAVADVRIGIRLARSAAVLGLDDIAAAVSVKPAKLKAALMSTTTRGVCADIARAALRSETLGAAVCAVCPPAAVRGAQLHELANEYRGSAAWSCRSRPQRQHPCQVRRYARQGEPVDVAETADTSMLLYEVLARGDDPEVRSAAASNPNCTEATIQRFVVDDDPDVRTAAAANPVCTEATIQRFVVDDDPDVRTAAASNPNCTEATIQRFVVDDDPDVRTEAAANPVCGSDLLSEFVRRPDAWDLKLGVAKNPSAPWQMLEILVVHGETLIHEAVASNPAAPGWMLENLAEDTDDEVRENVRCNPSCPEHVKAELDVSLGYEDA